MNYLFPLFISLLFAEISWCMDNPRMPQTANAKSYYSLRPGLSISHKILGMIRDEQLFSDFCEKYSLNNNEKQRVMRLLSKMDQINSFRQYLARTINFRR